MSSSPTFLIVGAGLAAAKAAETLRAEGSGGRVLLFGDEGVLANERLPYFYSDQYDLGMEYSGHATAWERVVFRGDPATRAFIGLWLKHQRVVAGMNANVWDVVQPIQTLIRDGRPVDPDRLADRDVPLDQVASEPARHRSGVLAARSDR